MNSFSREAQRLKNEVEAILRKHDVTPQDNIFYGEEYGNGSLEINIKKDSDGWHWQEVERGRVQRDKVTKDINEIKFWIIRLNVESKAGENIDWTARGRNKDPRSLWFVKSVKLMSKINPGWAEILKLEYDKHLN